MSGLAEYVNGSRAYVPANNDDISEDVVPEHNTKSEPIKAEDMARNVVWLELVFSIIVSIILWTVYGTSSNVQDYNIPMLYDKYTVTSSNGVESVTWVPTQAFKYNVGLTLPFVPLITGIFCGLTLVMWKMRAANMPHRTNPFRWVSDSLSSPLLATAIFSSFIDLELFGLVAFFSLFHISILFGYFLEAINVPIYAGKKFVVNWGPLYASIWGSALNMIPFIVYMSTVSSTAAISALEWSAFGVFLAGGVVNTIVQIGYYRYLSNPKAAMWPYKMSVGGLTNYAIYDSWLALGNMLFRGLSILLLMGACTVGEKTVYPQLP